MGGGELNVSSPAGNQEFSGLEVGLYTNNECVSVPVESILEEPVISGAEASAWLNKLEGNRIALEEDEFFGQPLVMGLSGGATAPDGWSCAIDFLTVFTSQLAFHSQFILVGIGTKSFFENKNSSDLIKKEAWVVSTFTLIEAGKPERGNLLRQWQKAYNSCGRPGGGLPKKVKDWVASHLPQPVMLPKPEPVPVAPMVVATAGATLLVVGAKQIGSLLGTLQSGGAFLLEGTAVVGSSLLVPIIFLPNETSSSDGDFL